MNQNFDLLHYFVSNNLFEESILRDWCERYSVKYITSVRFPGLVMLHYADACAYDKLWTPFSLASRGTIVDLKNKTLLAVPFFKWFNIGENPETSYDNLAALGTFETSEKLDGSMIIAFIDPNTNLLSFTTKGSFDSEHGAYANEMALTSDQKIALYSYALKGTLMFELIAKPFQIVVDYQKKGYAENLYLIGYRHEISNKLASFTELAKIAQEVNLPTFKTYFFNSLDKLLETAKDLSVLEEGFVLHFPGDLMVKVKGSAYLAAHRFISHLSDRNILQAVADGTASDLAILAPEEYRQDVLDKIAHFQKRVAELESMCYTLYSEAPKEGSRKDFALWVNDKAPAHLQGFMFQLLDHRVVDRKHMFRVLEEIDNIDGRTRI